MQGALDTYLIGYNTKRPHQGRAMNGRTPLKAFIDGLPKEKHMKTIPSTKAV